jgi:hypothetical protein
VAQKKLVLMVAVLAFVFVGLSTPGEAQFRRGRYARSVVVVGGGYYFADPFWYGYPWYGYPFAYPYPFGPYPPYRYAYDPGSAVRIEVTPKEAEVYVDGYYAGIVDDFDGVFQRLRLPPGQHELTLYRENFRTVHQTVYLTPDSTFKLKYRMEPLAAGDVAEPRPTPPPPPPPPTQGQGAPGQPPTPPIRRGPAGRMPFPPPTPGVRAEPSAYGTLSIRVQPSDAVVFVDGERWEGPQGQNRLVVEVAEGTHRIQIQKDGFESFSTDVTIRRGETTPLNVSLRSR